MSALFNATRDAEGHPEARRPTLRGWIDLSPQPAGGLGSSRREDRVLFSAPGLGVEVDVRGAGWHLTGRSLTVVFGALQSGANVLPPADAHDVCASLLDGAAVSVGGRFAAVHVDVVVRRAVLLTDRFAVHPLCWKLSDMRFAFSDRADGVPDSGASGLDLQALFNYAYFHVIPAPRTVFAGVERVEAATAVTCSAKGVQRKRIWSPRFAGDLDGGSESVRERFRSLVRDAVVRAAVDGNPGAFLSGGTDSSTVVGMACRTLQRGVPAYSIGFDAQGYDEMAYARVAARHFGADHREYYVSPADVADALPRVAAHYDQPFGNSSAVAAYLCALRARKDGITRMLAGDGGDELFGGNARYSKQTVFELYARIPQSLRAAVIEPFLGAPWASRMPLVRKAASYVAQARLPMPERMESYNLLERFGARTVFSARFLEAIEATEPLSLQRQEYARHAQAEFVNRMLAYDWRFTLADNDLPKVVQTCRLAGVEAAFPLLDDGLVDFSLRLAAADKVRGTRLRFFFKAALSDFLPAQILAKKKHGFGLPVGPWLLGDARLRDDARAAVDQLAARGIVRKELVDELFALRLREHAGYFGEMVWILTVLERWLSVHQPRFAL